MNRVFACSDLHGNYKVFQSILQKIDETDKVYVLGDVVDRGDRGFTILREMLSDPRFIVLKGNHEDLFKDDLKELRDFEERDYGQICNGGDPTIEEWQRESGNYGWIRILKNLPLCEYYINKEGKTLFLSHAGCTPPYDTEEDDLLWDRHHLRDDYNGFCDIVIHGHTPIPHMFGIRSEKGWKILAEEGPLWYCNKYKCCIDAGTYITNIAYLLDLDTFEYEIIKGE